MLFSRARDHRIQRNKSDKRGIRVVQSFKATAAAIVIVIVAVTGAPAGAQWFKYPTPGAPRLSNGQINLSAPAPRLANGKPDLSGVWMTGEPACGVGGPVSVSELVRLAPPSIKCPLRGATMSRHGFNMGVDLPGGLPYQPWLAELVQKRIADQATRGSTHQVSSGPVSPCLWTPSLSEVCPDAESSRHAQRDERPLPPGVYGSPPFAERSESVVAGLLLSQLVRRHTGCDTIGFRDDLWIDWDGSVITESKGSGRIRRPDFGHLEIEVTVDDPKSIHKTAGPRHYASSWPPTSSSSTKSAPRMRSSPSMRNRAGSLQARVIIARITLIPEQSARS